MNLPPRSRLHPLVRAVAYRIGYRGSCLLFFAMVDLVYALSLAAPPKAARTNSTLLFISSLAPLWLWSALWAASGLICLVSAFAYRDRLAFAAAACIKVLWGLTTLGGWLIGVLDRGWVSAAVWLGMAAWVMIIANWPEPPYLIAASPHRVPARRR